jgi:signal transduction histidine kinase
MTGTEKAKRPSSSPQSVPEARPVLVEQMLFLFRLWRRAPVPVALVQLYLGYLAWNYVDHASYLVWSLASLGIVTFRPLLAHWVVRNGQLAASPEQWERRFVAITFLSGAVSGSGMILFQPALPGHDQALFTMVMCCWAAGAVATSGIHAKTFFAFAGPFFAQIMLTWILWPSEGSLYVVFLLIALFIVLLLFVRNTDRMTLESIRIRFQRDDAIEKLNRLNAELREAREQAEEANRAKSRFLASSSHDLRQPLHAISLLAAALSAIAKDPQVIEIVARIDNSLQVMNKLFSALLELSRLDAGVVTVQKEHVALEVVLQPLESEYEVKCREKQLLFRFRVESVVLDTDPVLLERIIRNLLENALRYTMTGNIELDATVHNGGVDVAVRDTGIGIPLEQRENIFEEFYQIHNAARDRNRGLGLGLAIVRRHVELLGYRIEVESTPGRGSVFTCRVPRSAIVAEPVPRKHDVRSSLAPAVAGRRVVVVDDDEDVRSAIGLLLRTWGCEPIVTGSADAALDGIADLGMRPDLLVVDFRLPGGRTGVDVIHAMRERHPDLPALVITGDTGPDSLQAIRAAALRYLHKPVQPEALRREMALMFGGQWRD